MSGKFLITGASSPLGKALAGALLNEGIPCLLVVRDKKKLREFEQFSHLYEIWEGDLSSETSVSDLCSLVQISHQSIYAFVHLAASAPQDEFELAHISKAFTVNVFSAWRLAKICIDVMSQRNGGRILFAGSVGQKFGGKYGRPGYSGSKYLLEYFPRIFRECGAQNVLVNTLRLGVMRGGSNVTTGVSESEFVERVKLIPTGREITHGEAVRNILFLCSALNVSIHNAILPCSGGE